MSKKTLVLGASPNPHRYSYIAIQRLRGAGHDVVGIGKQHGFASDVEITSTLLPLEDIDTVTLYLNPLHQRPFYDYIFSLRPRRIIFNPGAENDELYQLALEHDILPMEACTLVMISTGQY
ncbi:MAG TPA: CoA-binding protein [Lacibacter sp.]|nr:CoA-binding protein [Lacibacter sp.]HMO87879.1 CoA-binding protein [Lacibacter sp.]HMP88466.1 CoA-binding protein [Lacibacter sp.]